MKHRIAAGALALAFVNAVALSARADDGTPNLDAVIVTATRTAQTVDETLASVTVITRKDIERTQARSVEELLRGVEGISISNSGGPGKLTSVFMRGASSNQVLVLVDGIKAGSPTTGMMAFQDLPIDQIDRIEIVRGPRSSLYGSEAVGGVIQIFTKRGGGPTTPSFSVGGGTFRTGYGSAGVSGGGDHAWFNVSASGYSTAGIDACSGNPVTFQGCAVIEPDRDGYRNAGASMRFGYRFDGGAEAEVHALRAQGHTKYDGDVTVPGVTNESQVVNEAYGADLRFAPVEAWRITAAAGRSVDRSQNYKNAIYDSRLDTQRDTFTLQNDVAVAKGQLATLGADYQQDRIVMQDAVTYPFTYGRNARGNRGLFAQYQLGLGAQDLQASARHDDNDQFGGHNTGAVAWGYALAKDVRAVVSYGTAFKAPTFNDLYYQDAFFSGNPDLQPERSRTTEVGLRGLPGWGRWSVNAYQTEIRDLIVIDSSYTSMANLDQARIRGLEFAFSTRVDEWEYTVQATAMRPEDTTPGATYGYILPRRAQRSGRVDADRRIGAYRVGMSIYGEGRKFDDAANTTVLAGYGLVDLRAEAELDKSWRLQAKAANVLDKHYETAACFNQPGRAFYLTLRYQPRR